jgi:enoyl-CoA hydratase/carnithine racemase
MAARHRLFDWIENVEALVVAAIHGHCLGGGLELALACDFRLASENARLGMPELQFGQVPGSGAPSRISYVAGPAVAKDLVITGRTVDAHEAMTLGLVHRVFDESMFDQSVEEFVALLASRPPLAASMAKRVIDTLARRGSAEARAVERLAQSALLDTDDLREGLDAYRERRPPQFTGT